METKEPRMGNESWEGRLLLPAAGGRELAGEPGGGRYSCHV